MASRSARHFRRYAVYLGLLAAAHKFCSAQSSATAPAPDSVPVVPAFQPFLYTHLFSDASGETHLAECEITAVPLSSIAAGLNDPRAASYNGLLAAGNKTVFNQLPVDEYQPLHQSPTSQFIATLSGSWSIEASDGNRTAFKEGGLLFLDNTPESPAAKPPQHITRTEGEQPCIVLISQVVFQPQVDSPCPFEEL